MNAPDTALPGNTQDMDGLRRRIDAIDEKLVALLNERMSIVTDIGAAKRAAGLDVVDFSREKQVLDRITRSNPGPMPDESLGYIYTEIIAAARSLQEPLKVAYLGPEATFTHIAAMSHFGHATEFVPLGSIRDVFEEVEKKKCRYGVVPVENSIEGAVNHTLDLFCDSDVCICAEIYTPVTHDLLTRCEQLSDIRVVYSHPQAFAQCATWLRSHLPGVDLIPCSSTSEAARRAAGIKGAAAVASSSAAVVYDLFVIAGRIQDSANNVTRFLVIGPDRVRPTGKDKTSLLFATAHVPGALFRVLEPISEAGLNMVKLESRPAKSASWHYLFFMDFVGHMDDPPVKEVYERMRHMCAFVKWLGSYPVDDIEK